MLFNPTLVFALVLLLSASLAISSPPSSVSQLQVRHDALPAHRIMRKRGFAPDARRALLDLGGLLGGGGTDPNAKSADATATPSANSNVAGTGDATNSTTGGTTDGTTGGTPTGTGTTTGGGTAGNTNNGSGSSSDTGSTNTGNGNGGGLVPNLIPDVVSIISPILGGPSSTAASASASASASSTVVAASSSSSAATSSAAPTLNISFMPTPSVTPSIDNLNPTDSAADPNTTDFSNNSAVQNKSAFSKTTIIILIAVGSSVVALGIIWTVIRKWKFSPSRNFEDRLQTINWDPPAHGNGTLSAGLGGGFGHGSSSGSRSGSRQGQNMSEHRRADSHGSFGNMSVSVPPVGGNAGASNGLYADPSLAPDFPPAHDFTAGVNNAGSGAGYADLTRGASLNRGASYGNARYGAAYGGQQRGYGYGTAY